jgi:uncharacterized repeat protein (TIGR01451 family)
VEWCEEETMRAIKSLFVGAVVAVGAFVSFGVLNPSMMSANAADCSTNSVIKCGFGTLAELRSKYKSNATGDLDDLYNRYGLTASVINGATAKTGTVYKDGRLVVDGKVVGTDAYSVGRHYKAGSTSFKAGGTTFYERPTTVSMISNSMSVIVFYDGNGNVIAAIMHDCGNPVRVKVVPQPEYRCDALTATKINRNTYDFAVAYTAKNGATFKNYSLNYGDGTSVTGRTTNPTRHVYANPGTYTITATVYFTVNGVAKSSACTAKVTVDQAPAYKCDMLQVTKNSRTEFTFMPKYTATGGATFKSYSLNLGDGSTKSGLTTPYAHTYQKPGTYTVTATVTFNIGTTAVTAECATKVVVDQPPVVNKPGVSIEKTVNGKENEVVKVGEAFTYEVKVTNTGNVALKDAVITDKAPANITFKSADAGTVANNAWTHKVSLAVKESKTFKITATLDKYVEGQIVNKACVDATEVTGTPDDCDTATVETPKEGEIVVCVIEEKVVKTIKESEFNSSTMTKDTEKCKEVPATPVTELPKTGATDLLGGSLGLGSIAGAMYYYADSRRRIQNAMNRR